MLTNKKNIFLIIIFLVLIFSIRNSFLQSKPIYEDFIPSKRAEKFFISSGSFSPAFVKEVIVDPFYVAETEKQFFSIWARDEAGIDSVSIEISTDGSPEFMELQLVEGTKELGRWVGEWVVRDVGDSNIYTTAFSAINSGNEKTEISLVWKAQY